MIPDTLAGLALFAASLGPGYVYVRVAERRVPRAERTQLLEAAELLVLGGLISTVVAMLVIFGARESDLINVETVRSEGLDYLLLHPLRGFTTLGTIFGLSYLTGWGAARFVHRKKKPSQQPGTVWREILGAKKDTHVSWATVELRDGRVLQGQVASYTLETPTEPRELALAAPLYQRRIGRSEVERVPDDFLLLREEDILYIAVDFQPWPEGSNRQA